MQFGEWVWTALASTTLVALVGGQCTPLDKSEPRSPTLHCTPDRPCTRFRAAFGTGGGGKGLNCDHGCATEFAPVGECVADLIVTDDEFPGIWRSCNASVAVLDIFPREPYPPTCTGTPVKTVVYQTDGVCRAFATPVADGPYWQMDCMTSYFPWIPPRVLAVGTSAGRVTVSSINATTRQITLLYSYNQSISALPVAGAQPTDPNDGMLYFAGYSAATRMSKIVSYEPRAKLGDWSFPTAREQPFAILGLGFYRPSAFGCDYEDPRCGVYVVADHGTHLDVGEVLGSGEYNVSSKPFPLGTATGVTAFNQNIGAFYVQMEVEKAANGGTSLVLVTCTLPSGELSSAAVANGYRAVALEFSEARSTLAGVFTADPPQYLADGRAVYHVGVLSPNGTVTIAGPGVSPTAADGKILVGVSAWQPLVGPSVGAITVLFESDSSTGSAPLYEVVSVNPWTGEIVTRASLDNPGQNTILQLGFA